MKTQTVGNSSLLTKRFIVMMYGPILAASWYMVGKVSAM